MLSWEDRKRNYAAETKFPQSLFIADDGRVCGMWIMGNDYRGGSSRYGSYPAGYLKRIHALFPEKKKVLHLFSGNVATIGAPYSVAQHSVMLSNTLPRDIALEGLLHDAAEAYLGDITSPLKRLLGDVYEKLEHEIDSAIATKYNLHCGKILGWPSEVKYADRRMLATERKYLMKPTGEEWPSLSGVEPYDFHIIPWGWEKSRNQFLYRFDQLIKERNDHLP